MVESAALGTEWQEMKENNKDRLLYVYNSGEYSDLTIVFPKEEITLKTHRLILSMSSSVLGAILAEPLTKELTLTEDSSHTFRKLLDLMYLDQMSLESVKESLEVYALARKYRMGRARNICEQYILSNLEEETALAALETIMLCDSEVMKKKCKEILYKNPDAVMTAENVSCLSQKNLRDLLNDEAMGFSSEVVPFKGLIAWGKCQVGSLEDEKPSGTAIREKIGDLLKEVRFLAMSCEEFVDNVVDTDILSHTECIHILRAIRGADVSTALDTVTLNPTRTRRQPSGQKKEDLSYCDLVWYSLMPNVGPCSNASLLDGLSSSRGIFIHHLNGPSGGSVTILDYQNKVVGSAASEDGLFNFTKPAALEKDKKYRISFDTKVSCLLHPLAAGKKTVGNVTLSYSSGISCELYFSE